MMLDMYPPVLPLFRKRLPVLSSHWFRHQNGPQWHVFLMANPLNILHHVYPKNRRFSPT